MISNIFAIVLHLIFKTSSNTINEFFEDYFRRIQFSYLLYSLSYFSFLAEILYKKFITLNKNLIPKLVWQHNLSQNENIVILYTVKYLHNLLCELIIEFNHYYGIVFMCLICYSTLEIYLNLYLLIFENILYLLTLCPVILNVIRLCACFHHCCAEVILLNLFKSTEWRIIF